MRSGVQEHPPTPQAVRVLLEQRVAEQRAIEEGEPCQHHALSVHRTIADLSDNLLEYGNCHRCHAWIKRTTWLCRSDDSVEQEPMTSKEIARLQAFEDHYRRSDAS